MKKAIITRLRIISAVVSVVLLGISYAPVYAAPLTALSDTMTRLKQGELSSHDILFNLSASNTFAAGESIAIDFDEDDTDADGKYFVVSGAATTATDLDFYVGTTENNIVGVDGDCTGHSGTADVAASVNDTTGVVTFLACGSYTASGSGATINFEYGTVATDGGTGTNRVTNHSATATLLIAISGAGTPGDDGKIAVVIIADDQIPVSATVNPTITLTVNTATLALGVIPVSSIATTSENNIVIGTNAGSGYTITVRDVGNGSSPGLYNSGASKLIASSTTTLVGGTEGYGGNCNKTSGDGTCAFADGSTENVTGFTLAGPTFASYGTKPSGNATFRIRVKAAINTSTEAGGYTDTLTVIGTANF